MKKWLSGICCLTVLLSLVSCNQAEDEHQTEMNQNTDTLDISVYCYGPNPYGEGVVDYLQNETVQRIEEKYNVKFSTLYPNWDKESDILEQLFRTETYCDLMYISSPMGYQGGDEVAVADNVFWDLTDYIETYMPNYYKIIHSDPELMRLAYNDSGKIIGLSIFSCDIQNKSIAPVFSAGGMIVRKDWLEAADMELPVTYDDWEDMLTLFKEKYGCEQPYYISCDGFSMFSPGFSGGFGAIPSMQKNGDVIEYGPMTQGWKDYVTLIHRWYEKGLIGSEYITNDAYGIDEDAGIRGESGAMVSVYTKIARMEEENIDEHAEFCAVQYPVQNVGETCQAGDMLRQMGSKKLYVTKAVSEEDLPRVLKMLDDFYDFDYGFELAYGQENDTWTYDAQGEITFTDKVVHNEWNLPEDKAVESLLMPSNLMLLKDWSREVTFMTEKNKDMCEVWDKDGVDLYVPVLQLTASEKEVYDNIMLDVEPYMKEMTNKMIVGAVDIDTEWDIYIQTLKSMGIEGAVNLYQNAYNRYMHR